jgi:hypothetical protein
VAIEIDEFIQNLFSAVSKIKVLRSYHGQENEIRKRTDAVSKPVSLVSCRDLIYLIPNQIELWHYIVRHGVVDR